MTRQDGTGGTALPQDAAVQLAQVAGGFARPVAMAARAGESTLYVGDQPGRVWAVRDGEVDPRPWLDLAGEVSTDALEQGVQGMTFSPDGTRFYLHYTDLDGHSRLHEWAVAGGQVQQASRREILLVEQPFGNHNGADVVFGPDGMLYVAQGDGGDGDGVAGNGHVEDPYEHGQNRGSLLGTILRVDPRPEGSRPYTIPRDNPFAGDPDACPEVWVWGLRNPWRFSFDRLTGDLWIGDTGHVSRERIYFAAAGDQAGANFGWSAVEGSVPILGRQRPAGSRDPIYEYGRDEGVSVIGGFVYRGSRIPALGGAYVFADYVHGDLVALWHDRGVLTGRAFLGLRSAAIVSLGLDHDGELYVVDQGAEGEPGSLLRLDPR